jgi:probable phosphoglycerate mutase
MAAATLDVMNLPPLYIARHAETVFNASARLQGQHRHTPLTRRGYDQALAMGDALRSHFGARPDIALWASNAGRAQQTLSLVCEALEMDFFAAQLDPRLQEIHVGSWAGRLYADIIAEHGMILDPDWKLFAARPPEGEWYDDIARRMALWLEDLAGETRPCLVISHGIAARVLRGLLVGGPSYHGTAIAPDAPQGTIFRIEAGVETTLHLGTGADSRARLGAL